MGLRRLAVVAATVLAVAAITPLRAGTAVAASALYSGSAAAVDATVLGQHVVLADTGPLPSSGGALEASLLEASVPGLLSVEVLHAATVAQGSMASAEASVADFSLAAGGNSVAAGFLAARAAATCNGGKASIAGSSEIAMLTINGQPIAVTGEANQTVPLPNGRVLINEQATGTSASGNSGDITVTALHVIVDGVADVIVSRAHADIGCPAPTCDKDFITGGGWITTSSRANFAVAGGIKNGAFWGHLQYVDHGTGLKAKGTGVTAYAVTGTTSRHIEGTAEVNGQGGFTYRVDVADNGEPGRSDTIVLSLSNGYAASGTLSGGNIQLHICK